MHDLSDKELLEALGFSSEPKKVRFKTPKEERIIAGFENIAKFIAENGRQPEHGEDKDIFERLFAIRLDCLREQTDSHELLSAFGGNKLFNNTSKTAHQVIEEMDDDSLLAELGISVPDAVDISKLKHVKPREEIRAAEEIANRTVCKDFDSFKPLFLQVKQDLDTGVRETRKFGKDADIKKGEFFIVFGQIAFVAEVGEEFVTGYDRRNSRLRVIYDNGTESDVLLRSLQRALYKDEAGRRVTDSTAGPLFGDRSDEEDLESGTIYVLRSHSDHPAITAHRDLIHKIGVTGGKVEQRIGNASTDATYLLADVEIVATYKLFNINRAKLESLIHRFFLPAQLDLVIQDRFGNPVKPQEWFLVPLAAINEAVEKIKDQSIKDYQYDPKTATLRKIEA